MVACPSPLESASAASDEEAWESLLEVNPQLGTGRLVLHRGRKGGCASKLSEVADHRCWSLRLSRAGGTLNLLLDPPAGDDNVCSTMLSARVGEGVEVLADGLRTYADHICIALAPTSVSQWVSKLLAPSAVEEQQEVRDLVCRQCGQQLLCPAPGGGGRATFLMPSSMWQACAEVMACEECTPLGVRHIAAAQGRVYVSPQCLVVSAADLLPEATRAGQDGLVRCCACSAVVGESQAQAEPAAQAFPRQPGRPRKRLFCQEGWSRGAVCRSQGVVLYKHRISMPLAAVGGADVDEDMCDALAEVTEVSAVGAQLLGLRAAGGSSRFLLVPGPPEADGVFAQDVARTNVGAEALELRIIVPELILMGPVRHDARPAPAELGAALAEHATVSASAAVGHARRAAKVYFRRRTTLAAPTEESQWLTIPPVAFDQVCAALDDWVDKMPPSHSLSPVSGKDGLGTWLTSCLPLPPRDSSAE
mmetsp:Transcript_130137/g.417606  ORF Transcript_130137/g.417606 Transcript_130137/m.417606 type:complete len:477 (-) Transcript_130137:11-1441(-)